MMNIAGSVMITRVIESVLISRLLASISIHGKFAESNLNPFEEIFSDPTASAGINGYVSLS
jgi:hypothetical protein